MSSRNQKSTPKKSFRKKSSRISTNTSHSYEQLEARQMLTVDLGLNLVSGTQDDNAFFANPSVHGAVGPNHIIQLTNGVYSLRGIDGTEIATATTQEFFRDIAGADISAGTDIFGGTIQGEIQDARVVYDESSGRWFASAVVAAGNGNALGGNDILLAVSRTNNPVDGFRSVQFTGDPINGQFNSFATLAVDDTSVAITTDNSGDTVSVYAIPVADLLTDTPIADSSNITRFDNLDPEQYGQTIQFTSDSDGSSSPGGISYGIGTFDGGTQISVLRLITVGDPTVDLLDQFNVTVPEYVAAPDGRQPNAVDDLNNISPAITGSAVEEGDFLWAVHTVEGSNGNSAIRWYQINRNSLSLTNTGLIEDPDADYLYPSIAVNDFGAIAIGFTGTSPNIPPSGFVQLGFSANGLSDTPTVTFPQDPIIFQQGLANIVNPVNGINPFGEYSATTFDPDDPFSFYTFQEFVAGNDEWGTAIAQASINDISPVIAANDADNEITLRRSTVNNSWLEIVIDGSVTDTYQISTLDTLTLNLGAGNDLLRIDYGLGPIATELGIVINGGLGTDEIDLIDSNGHQFDITGDGSGQLDIVNTFTGFEVLTGSAGGDVFTVANSASDWELNGQGGDDTFLLNNSATGNILAQGGTGDDSYGVPILNFPSVTVVDSPSSENDTLIGLGTIANDEIIVTNDQVILNGEDVSFFSFAGVESLSFDGVAGDDTFQIRAINADTTFFGGAGNDTFNVASNAPSTTGDVSAINGELSIDGGLGTNRLRVSNTTGIPNLTVVTADQITGLTDQPINYTGNFGTLDGQQGIILDGSSLNDNQFEIRDVLADNSVRANGGLGNDIFTVRNSSRGDVVLNGRDGSDTYRTSFGLENRRVIVSDSGTDEGVDRFSIRSTDAEDVLTINNNSFGAFGEMFIWSGVENLVLDTNDGDDIITVNGNNTSAIRVILDAGNDVGIVNGTSGIGSLRFDGNSGSDMFFLNSSVADSFILALGGEGTDTFEVFAESFARSRVDGQEGNDFVTVEFASRDSRRINARDTGGGTDQLNVLGTPTADRVDIRPRVLDREGEFITYDENTEAIDYQSLGSNDVANVFGTNAAVFNANLGFGNDTVNIFSTSNEVDNVNLQFSLATGLDVGNVFRVSENATVGIFGQDGSDSFNVGSTLITDDGNLNQIRGNLTIGGGSQAADGSDTLQVNDRGNIGVPFNYVITDRQFASATGPNNIARVFDSFSYSGLESVFASGTDGRNIFNVTASASTIIRVDGNSQAPDSNGDILNVFANAESQLFGSPALGFLTFTAGLRNVSFQEIEDVRVTNTGGTSLTLGDDDLRDDVFSFDGELEQLIDLTIDLGI